MLRGQSSEFSYEGTLGLARVGEWPVRGIERIHPKLL